MRPPWSGIHQGVPNPVVCGRRFCTKCGRWRLVCDFASLHGQPRTCCSTCQAVKQRVKYRTQTPLQRQLRREYERIYREAQRRRRGVQPRNFRHRRSVIDRVEFVGLPPEPLLAAITSVGLPDIVLGAAAGVPPRSVYRLRVGESRHVRIDVADKLALAIGVPLWLIYGDTPAVSLATPPQLRRVPS